jgi:hypothetical protein
MQWLLELLLSTPQSRISSQHRFFIQEEQLQQIQFGPDLFQQLPMADVGFFAHYLAPNHRGLEQKATYAMAVSYYGASIRGGYEWGTNAYLSTVRGTLTGLLEVSLESTLPGNHDRVDFLIKSGCRTDDGVSAKASVNVFSFVSRLHILQ